MAEVYYGADAVKIVQKMVGRPLTHAERRVVEEEGFVNGAYRDGKGNLTAGVGQTGKYLNMSFEETFKDHEDTARKLIKGYDKLPENVKGELVQAAYRGDLQGSPKFRELFNAGRYGDAAKAFLRNDDYERSKKLNASGKPHGVKGRMERVANAVAGMGAKKAVLGMLTGEKR